MADTITITSKSLAPELDKWQLTPVTVDIEKLNAHQASDLVHPFTCGSGNRTDAAHTDGEGVLTPTPDGWECPFCSYRQQYGDLEIWISSQPRQIQTMAELVDRSLEAGK